MRLVLCAEECGVNLMAYEEHRAGRFDFDLNELIGKTIKVIAVDYSQKPPQYGRGELVDNLIIEVEDDTTS